MKFKKNIFKMVIHSAIPILISLTLLILYLIFIKSINITFYMILVILLGSIVSQSKFLYILILLIGDVIGNKVVKEEVLLNAIVDNNDLEFIGAKRKYTLFDLFDIMVIKMTLKNIFMDLFKILLIQKLDLEK